MRSLLTILFFFAAFSAFSQTTSNYDYLQAYRRFTLAGRSVKGISNDTAILIGSVDSLVTQYALKGYLAGHGIGIKGRQHQLLGAKADSTAELQYLEPLVEGAFVVSDSELNAATLVPTIYDLRNGQKWISDNAGNFSKDTSGASYFTDYGVRRFLYNPSTQKTFYVKPDSSYSQIGSGNVFNVHADTTIQNTYVTNDNSYYYSLSDSSWLDDRDFYNDGSITSPYRIRRYDNAYIDSLFASITPGGGGGGTTVNNYYTNKLPFNGDTSYYLAGDSILHKLPVGVLNTQKYNLPYNADSLYYLAGDSILHRLPIFDSTSISKRIDTKLNITDTAGKWLPIGTKLASTLKLTTNGQSGPSQYNDTTGELNIPNYFFATNSGDSIDYSLSAMTTIYNEKGPGEYITSGHGVTANPDNFSFPFKQLKALDISGWSAGDYVSFKNATTANSTAYTFMRAFIRLKQAVPVIQSLSFQFYLNGSAVSKIISMVNYGLDKSMINKYQNISIPMSAFGFTDNNFDEIRLIFGGGSSPDGLYLDLFQFQNATSTENKYVTDVFRIPGTTTVQKVLGGQNSFAFDDSVGAAVDTQYLRRDINLKLNISDTTNKWMPRATPIVNAFNGRAGNVLPQSADYSAYYEPLIAGGTTAQYWRGDKTWQPLTSSVVPEGSNLYYTDARARAAITLTTTGTSGVATYSNGVLNIPNYAATVGTITWLGTAYNINSGNNITLATPTTSNVTEGTNLYYTDARARASISVTGGGTYNATTGVINITGGTSNAGWSLTGNTGGTNVLGLTSNNSLRLYTNNLQRMMIDSTGKVGIGTTAPAFPLQVGVSGNTMPNANVISKIASNTSGADFEISGNGYARMFFNDYSRPVDQKYYEMLNLSSDLLFSRINDANTSRTTYLAMKSNGQVGIGTTAPTAGSKLHVAGNVFADGTYSSQVNVNSNNSSTFVNLNVGTAAYSEVAVGNGSAATDQLRMVVPSQNYITQNNLYIPDGGTIMAEASLSNGLTLGSRATTGGIRFLTTASATDLFEAGKFMPSGNLVLGATTDIPSAQLNVTSTTKGVLFPRMTTAQRDAIASPAEGLTIYNTTTHQNETWNATTWAH